MGKVKNLNGTSKFKAKNGKAWLKNWEEQTERIAFGCCNSDCYNLGELVGAHVQKCSSNTDNKWYIVPLCKSCNGKESTEEFNVDFDDLVLVNEINEN